MNFLGYNIVCNNFTNCVDHQQCRVFRSQPTPKRNAKASRAEYQRIRRSKKNP